jgi:hypothetical protein
MPAYSTASVDRRMTIANQRDNYDIEMPSKPDAATYRLTRRPNGRFGDFHPQGFILGASRLDFDGGQLSFGVKRLLAS